MAAHRRQGQICPHQGHGLQTGQHVPGAVAMAGRKAAGMARIQGLEHIQAFFPPDFTYDDPIRPHAQRCPDQVTDFNGAFPLGIGISGFQPYQVGDLPDL